MLLEFQILCGVLFFFLTFSVYFNYKLGRIILKFEDSIEESLDILDARYSSMTSILEKPIFFDSLEVRQVIKDIKISRDSLLHIANSLAQLDDDENNLKNKSG